MLHATIVTTYNQLQQIHLLNQQNLKSHLDELTKKVEGFVSWEYPLPLLKQLHELAPSVIVADGETVAGYALTALKASRAFHPDLENMFHHLDPLPYRGIPLSQHQFYCMGQICVAKAYRGMGVTGMLYAAHRRYFSSDYDFILTEISSANIRSLKAHEKVGFETIHTYRDDVDEWHVVVWDWQ